MDAIDLMLSHIFSNDISVFLIVGPLMLVAAELGHRFGLSLHRSQDEPRSKQAETVQAAALALMGLLLAFTFSAAIQRYDQRNRLVVEEANAIGTAYLRVAFLPETMQGDTKNLFRHYVAVRLQRQQATDFPEKLAAHEAQLAKIQQQLWDAGAAVERSSPNSMTTSYTTALNAMFDSDSFRLKATRDHVPGAVWLLLLIMTATGCGFTGYRAGTLGRRSKLPLIILPLLVTVVIVLVSDLDRPAHGLVRLNESSLYDLQHSFGPISDK
ncbi:MAG TPA: hypothetical protein VGO57_14825 [Verrucomicrobiae bacterium]|jgi:hypothetical protein